MILDEPTNHLDIESIEALEGALEDYPGTLLCISHDRYFINKVCSRIVAVEDFKLSSYMGNYGYYKQKKEEYRNPPEPIKINKSKDTRNTVQAEDAGDETALKKLEAGMKLLEDEAQVINNRMSGVEIGYDELNKLYCRREEIEDSLGKMMDEWLGLCDSNSSPRLH